MRSNSAILFRFERTYFGFALVLFAMEVLIALYVHDTIVRPYIGDVLVVILLYCTVKAFIEVPALQLALSVLIFAFGIEALQYFKFVSRIGLGESTLARTLIGTSFAWIDLLAYVVGTGCVLIAEHTLNGSITSLRGRANRIKE